MCEFIISNNEILNNVRETKRKLKKNVKLCAVVKANAYGFGLSKICKILKHEVDYFAVARLGEFLEYKALNIDKPCIILSPLEDKSLLQAIKNRAEITISNNTNISLINEIARKQNLICKVHLKLDTGMNRFGVKSKDKLIYILNQLKSCENIKLTSVYSHIFDCKNTQKTNLQRTRFIAFKEIIDKFGFKPFYHLSSSAGVVNLDNQFDMVRLGIGIYHKNESEHKLVSKILEIKELAKGEYIGYSSSFKAKKNMTIAVCEGGYADGVNRLLSNKGEVIINNKLCKIVGNICMDCFMVDISEVEARIFDKVIIFGKSGQLSISVCTISKLCGTIPYEIYTSISKRVKRVYKWRNHAGYYRKIQGEKTCLS